MDNTIELFAIIEKLPDGKNNVLAISKSQEESNSLLQKLILAKALEKFNVKYEDVVKEVNKIDNLVIKKKRVVDVETEDKVV